MRLWSIHPGYLDAQGLVALWREGLLAQKVLQGRTKGYRNHPQLKRFQVSDHPLGAIGAFLGGVADEADQRGYNFDRTKICKREFKGKPPVTSGQVVYEMAHLLGKLETRDPERHAKWIMVKRIKLHPIFKKVPGDVEEWEVI